MSRYMKKIWSKLLAKFQAYKQAYKIKQALKEVEQIRSGKKIPISVEDFFEKW